MCGIAGYLAGGEAASETVLRSMTSAISHRGPDGSGEWIDADAGVALGHRRLAIIDLSEAGHQPMASPSGRYVLTYNGEIYNFQDLRAELEALGAAPEWKGHSDTEVMVAAFEHWGVIDTLPRLNGMFAFAVWDRKQRLLTLARDRLGEKPLYYSTSGGPFLFGSELKALTAHNRFDRSINREAITAFLRYNYIPAPLTIWSGIAKLKPAHFLQVSVDDGNVAEPKCYWDLASVVDQGLDGPSPREATSIDELELLLKDAVLRRTVADVPLGAFLSGGIDSSLIVSLMQAQSARPVRTFTIGFEQTQANEAAHAKAISQHLGTEHTELYLTPDDGLSLVPRLPQIWDEPFADASQLPTYFVSEMTRRHVTVALTGDGGDEVFGGYNRYSVGARLWANRERVPRFARPALASLLRSPTILSAAAVVMNRLPKKYQYLGVGDRLPKIAHVLEVEHEDDLYSRLVSNFQQPEQFVLGAGDGLAERREAPESLTDFRERMMFADTLTYLPDDILAKVDRASMAVSLETRVPFLDHRVVEYAWRLPIEDKIRGGQGKHILRSILDRYVPRALVERPKMGFGVPIDHWLKTSLRAWADDLLSEDRLRAQGLLDNDKVQRLWAEEKNKGSNHYQVWNLLMLQAWLEEHKDARV